MSQTLVKEKERCGRQQRPAERATASRQRRRRDARDELLEFGDLGQQHLRVRKDEEPGQRERVLGDVDDGQAVDLFDGAVAVELAREQVLEHGRRDREPDAPVREKHRVDAGRADDDVVASVLEGFVLQVRPAAGSGARARHCGEGGRGRRAAVVELRTSSVGGG